MENGRADMIHWVKNECSEARTPSWGRKQDKRIPKWYAKPKSLVLDKGAWWPY